MGRYIAKKAIYTFITLFGVVSVIFYLFNVLPGDPARMMLGQNEDEEQLKIVQKKYDRCVLLHDQKNWFSTININT